MATKRPFPADRLAVALLVSSMVAVACVSGTTAPSTEPPRSTTVATGASTTTGEPSCPDAFCLVYHIRPEAAWSDGAPVTAADFIHTYRLLSTQEGYSLVTEFDAPDEKTVRFALAEPYGAWQSLFDVVVPSHVLDPLSVSAGPFRLASAGEDAVVLTRNSPSGPGDVQTVTFIPVDSVRDGLARLRSGDLDVLFPPALGWVASEIRDMDGVRLDIVPGPTWEHLDFNLADPLLAQHWVREAISAAIDRKGLLGAVTEDLSLAGFQLLSAIWPVGSARYAPVAPVGDGPATAMSLLEANGCARGEDGVFSCGGERMSFVYVTTLGDPLRRAQFEFVRDALAEAGIEVLGRFVAPVDAFADEFLFGGPDVWQIIGFPWAFSADPGGDHERLVCGGALNVSGFCDDAVDALLTAASTEPDPERRAEIYRDADRAYLAQLPILTMLQRPALLAWNQALLGPSGSMLDHLWNLEQWRGKGDIVIGIDRLPIALDPLAPGVDDLILGPVMAGAFRIDGSLSFVAELVDTVETVVGSR